MWSRGARVPARAALRSGGCLVDSTLAGYRALAQQDRRLLAEAPRLESLLDTLEDSRASLRALRSWMETEGLGWSSPFLGANVLELVLALAVAAPGSTKKGWLLCPRSDAATPRRQREQRQKDFLFLLTQVLPHHDTPLARALAWRAAPSMLRHVSDLHASHGSEACEREILDHMVQLVPRDQVGSAVELLFSAATPLPAFIGEMVSQAGLQTLKRPMLVHYLAHFVPTTQQDCVGLRGTPETNDPFPPGMTPAQVWALVWESLEGRPLPPSVADLNDLCDALVNLGPVPPGALPSQPPPFALDWLAHALVPLATRLWFTGRAQEVAHQLAEVSAQLPSVDGVGAASAALDRVEASCPPGTPQDFFQSPDWKSLRLAACLDATPVPRMRAARM